VPGVRRARAEHPVVRGVRGGRLPVTAVRIPLYGPDRGAAAGGGGGRGVRMARPPVRADARAGGAAAGVGGGAAPASLERGRPGSRAWSSSWGVLGRAPAPSPLPVSSGGGPPSSSPGRSGPRSHPVARWLPPTREGLSLPDGPPGPARSSPFFKRPGNGKSRPAL
jgi:hypothetical protein